MRRGTTLGSPGSHQRKQIANVFPRDWAGKVGTVRRVVEAGFDPGTVDDDGHNIVINGILDATWLRQVDARPEFIDALGGILRAKRLDEDVDAALGSGSAFRDADGRRGKRKII